MKRELKFRAWNKITQAMYYNHSVSISIGGSVHYLDLTGEWECDADANGEKGLVIELMQFTGLNDKNGVDIYEGDILQDTLYGSTYKSQLIFINGGFCCVYENRAGTYNISDRMGYGVKVIGNIYETPELLETKNVELSERKVE